MTSGDSVQNRPQQAVPKVFFLGAGPGDPSLLTIRGAELLASAAVVVHEDELHRDIIETYVPEDTLLRPVSEMGVQPHTRGRRLGELAQEHGMVVRLAADDGLLFTSTTAEAQVLSGSDVGFEIVPGVGASSSAAAFTGTPLTNANVRSVRYVSATDMTRSDVSRFANTGHVISGTVTDTITAVEGMLGDEWEADTPALVVAGVSTVHQHSIETTLGQLPDRLREEFDADTVVQTIFGTVVEQRRELSWFESKPLFGWQVLVPRTREQGAETVEVLAEYGAEGTVVPTIAIQPPRSPRQMERAIHALVDGDYQWLGLTSVNAVRAVKMWLADLGLDVRSLAGVKVAAVGDKTAEALREWGIEPELLPSGEQSARGMLEDWPVFDDEEGFNRVLLPRADIATDVLVEGLTERGWKVDDVTAYRTVRAAPPPKPIRESIKGGDFDAVLFTSSSTVRNLVGIAGKPHPSTVIAAIGPATAQTAQDHGLHVDVLADEASLPVLIAGLSDFARKRRDDALAEGIVPVRPSQDRRNSRRSRG